MRDTNQIMHNVCEKVKSHIQHVGQVMQNFLNGHEADDATMAGQQDVAFALKTARVVVVQKSDTEFGIELQYNNEYSSKGTTEDFSSEMKSSFYRCKQIAFG